MRKFFLSLILALVLIAAPAPAQDTELVTVNLNIVEVFALSVDFNTVTFSPGAPNGEWIQADEGPLGLTCAFCSVSDAVMKMTGTNLVEGPGGIIPWSQFAVTGTGDFAFPKTLVTSAYQYLHTFTSSGSFTGSLDFEYENVSGDPGSYSGQIELKLQIAP